MPYPELKALLTDIGVEELGHLEIIGTIVHQLTRSMTPEGNDRKRLGVFVHIIPLANQMKGQAVWYAWHLCQTPREYLEENNRRFANTGMWSAVRLDSSDFDLEESE